MIRFIASWDSYVHLYDDFRYKMRRLTHINFKSKLLATRVSLAYVLIVSSGVERGVFSLRLYARVNRIS